MPSRTPPPGRIRPGPIRPASHPWRPWRSSRPPWRCPSWSASGWFTGRDTAVATVADPLDDAAFLYWIRTVPLEVGKRYEYRRYFRPERNPVIVEVLKRERVGVAGKKWDAIVVRPRIPNGGGIFAEKADARMWLSDDSLRIMLALQSKFSFGQVTLKLKEIDSAKQNSASGPEHP